MSPYFAPTNVFDDLAELMRALDESPTSLGVPLDPLVATTTLTRAGTWVLVTAPSPMAGPCPVRALVSCAISDVTEHSLG